MHNLSSQKYSGVTQFSHMLNVTNYLVATNGQFNSFIVAIQHFTNFSIGYSVSLMINKSFTILERKMRHDCMQQGNYLSYESLLCLFTFCALHNIYECRIEWWLTANRWKIEPAEFVYCRNSFCDRKTLLWSNLM